jgi:spore germination protein GerM
MRKLIAVIAVFVLVLSACGDDVGDGGRVTTIPETPATTSTAPATPTTQPDGSTPTTTPDGTTTSTATPDVEERFVQVYFVQDGTYARAVTRAVPGTAGVAANAIGALIEGPTAAEEEDGLSSAIPEDTLLLGIDIADGTATIDLSSEFEQGGGSFAMFSRLGQVVYTLTQFDTVDEVVFWIDGKPVTVFSGEGILLEGPVDRSDYESALPTTSAADRWTQDELPAIDGVAEEDLRRVVLVVEDDVLNTRSGAGVDNPIIGMLEPGAVVRVTGPDATVGSSTWVEIAVPGGTGWVNARYLAAVVDAADFAADPAVIDLLDRMAELMADEGDLTEVVSRRGLYVAHNAPPLLFEVDQLDTIMTEATTYKWGSAALEPDSPELPSRTFATAVGERFVSAYDDADTSIMFNEAELGGNGIPAEFVIPFEFRGLNFVSVFDSGDDEQYGGLDWTAWYVSIDYEDGEPVVVGMTVNEWSP